MHKVASSLLILLGALLLPTLGHALTPTYSLTALPPVPGHNGEELVTAINNQGTVVGLFNPVGTDFWASWEYAHGKYTFPIPPTGQNYVNGINDFGVLIGQTSDLQGFAYFKGKTITINPNASSLQTWPSGINDLGQIVGFFSPAGFPLDSNDHVFLRQPDGAYTDLGAFGNVPGAYINNQGTIIITDNDFDAPSTSAYVRQPGSTKLQQIPPLVPGGSVGVISINNLGVITGWASLDPEIIVQHAIVYAKGKVIDIGTLPPVGINPGDRDSYAECINDFGVIVGNSLQEATYTPDPSDPEKPTENPGYSGAFVYYDGVMHNLNAVLSASAKGWVINDAWSINDEGQIAASAQYNGGYQQPVILTPSGFLP
jgi:uncharacterized membrane protein